jgi:hypothetical protein
VTRWPDESAATYCGVCAANYENTHDWIAPRAPHVCRFASGNTASSEPVDRLLLRQGLER